MELFRHRPLFLCCTVFLLASVAGFFLSPLACRTVAVLLGMGALLGGVVWLRRRRRTALLLAALACLLSLLAVLHTSLYLHGGQAEYLSSLEGETVPMTGVITERRGSGGYMTVYEVSLTSVSGRETHALALLTCHYVSDLQPGYAVSMEVTVTSLSEAAGDGYDETALLGDGYRAGLLSLSEESVTVTEENRGGFRVKAGQLRRYLSAKLNQQTRSGAEGLPSALLLGDRSALSDTVRRDFARAGVSHLLAISGFHMTLLFGLLEGLLRLLRMHKRWRAALLGVSALGYLALLGFPPSATRAVLMLGAVYLSTLLSARADPLTSLGLAGALLVAVSPCTVADAGFWMSYVATLGLIALMPVIQSLFPVEKSANLGRRLLAGICRILSALVVGVVAMSFTLFIVAAVIGELGILSPVSTLLLTPLCGVVLVLSPLTLLLSGTAVGVVPGDFLAGACGWMARITARLGDPSWAVVSLRHPAVAPVAFLMVAAVLVLLTVRLPRTKRWLTLLPLLVGWVVIGGITTADYLLTKEEIHVTYLQPSSQADMLVLTEGQQAVICDLSNGSLTAMSAAVREVEAQGATEVAVLLLTHYHSRTAGTLTDVLAREKVRELWCPAPTNQEDYFHLLACMEKAEALGVPVVLYRTGESLRIFGTCEATVETATLPRSAQPVLLLSVTPRTGSGVVYCGAAAMESPLADSARRRISEAGTVIFGNHGPLPKAPFGEELTFREDASVVFSAYGDVAGWFIPDGIAGQPLWQGQWRGRLTSNTISQIKSCLIIQGLCP